MSSWASATQMRPPPRLGYRQILPEGTFVKKENPVTVVSAYYEMSSKNKKSDYIHWIRLFLENIPCHLVFFTEEHLVPFIEECRKNFKDRTVIIPFPRKDWTANQLYPQSVWDELFKKDPEKNIIASSEVYKVWFEKPEFVLRAIERNPFGHTDFAWVDAGFFRDPRHVQLVAQRFPVADRIPTDRILLLNVWPFVRNDDVLQMVNGESFPGGGEDRPRIGGGIVAAAATLWPQYSRIYRSIVERNKKAGLFWGKDQTILKTAVLENKRLFSLIELKQCAPEMWFYSGLYLGCSPKLFEYIRSEKTNGNKRTYNDFLRIDA